MFLINFLECFFFLSIFHLFFFLLLGLRAGGRCYAWAPALGERVATLGRAPARSEGSPWGRDWPPVLLAWLLGLGTHCLSPGDSLHKTFW